MGLSEKLRGTVSAEICAAFPEAVLTACAEKEIALRQVERLDACTLHLEVFENDWESVRELAHALQAETRLRKREGGSLGRLWLLRRIVLILSLVFVGTMLLWSELHIWKIDVQGCEKLTRGQVLRALEDSGVGIGSYWPALSSDAVRARMLLRLPELAWMTVNVSGSCAHVFVVERTDKPQIYSECEAADIRAARTGILRELTVLNGRALVSRGSAVVEGDLLVTGSLDSLIHPVRRVRAEARILADTWYEWTAVEPEGTAKEGGKKSTFGCLALRFGKKRVNLYTGSRKDLDGYDKIVHEYTVGIEGLFAFPVSVIWEELKHEDGDRRLAVSEGERLKEMLAARIEGEILQARCVTAQRDGCLYTTLRAHCLENIAQTAEMDPP